MLKYCDYCGQEFVTANSRRAYCCPQHRRAADNERKAERRAEETERRNEYIMPDSWAQNDLGEDVTANSIDWNWTAECEPDCMHEAIGGPMACQQCPHWKADAKNKKKHKPGIDLLCEMCRSGTRV